MAQKQCTDLTPSRTPKWREKFLDSLAKTGNVTLSAESAGIARETAYANQKKDKSFREAWDDALQQSVDRLEAVARDRAVNGWDEPVFGSLGGMNGTGVVGYKRRFDNGLLRFLLQAHGGEKYRTAGARRAEGDGVTPGGEALMDLFGLVANRDPALLRGMQERLQAEVIDVKAGEKEKAIE